ncbi:protein huluwa-like [Aquarana catesbeiana]|uniref:protein huluwa-like n=1 Tax=Aquarana catesbeiana TaxID=8400 RepID=UPI003CC9A995
MMSVNTSVFPLAGGVPSSEVAPSVEEKWVLQPSLALLVFILIPCVVLLFFLNCFLLFHRLPSLSLKKRSKRRGGSRGNNPCVRAAHCRVLPGCLNASNKSLCDGRCASTSQGLEPTLALGESAHVSLGTQSREWCQKLEETPGLSYSLSPSRMAIMPFSSRSCGMPQEEDRSWNEVEDDRGGTRSSSEQETRYNAAPPNTPAAAMAPGTVTPKVKFCRKTSTQRKRLKGVTSFTPLGSALFDNASSIPPEDTPSYLYHNSSSTGPGLDSDFGVSLCTFCHQTVTPAHTPGLQEWSGITMTPATCGRIGLGAKTDKSTTYQSYAASSTGSNCRNS